MTATRIGRHSRLAATVLAAFCLALAGDATAEPAADNAALPDPRAVAQFRTAAALQNRELDDLAAAEWAAFLEQFPSDPLAGKARFYRGLCLIRLRHSAEAETELARVLADHPDLEPDLLQQAYANLAVAQYNRAAAADGNERIEALDAAIATLGDSLRRFPDGRYAPLAHFYRAEASWTRGDLPAAAQGYEALVSGWPEHHFRAAALYGWGATLQELQRADEAHRAFGQFLAEFPDHEHAAEVHFRRGEGRAEAGELRAALADFQRINERWPDSLLAPQALLLQSELEQRLDDLVAAQVTLGRFLEDHPGHVSEPQARFRRAAIRHELDLYEEAHADVSALLAAEPTEKSGRSDALFLRGLCEAKLNRHQEAARTFQTLLEEDPQYAAADRVLYELAWAYDSLGDAQQAALMYRRLATEHPNSPMAAECCFRVGLWQLETKDFAGAARSFAGARDRPSDESLKEKAAHQLGWANFRLQEFAEAEQAFANQLSDSPDGMLAADARLMIGEARFARQDYAGALAAYTTALDHRGGTAELRELALLHAAQSAAQLKDWSQSVALLDRCETEFPATRWQPQIQYERGWALYQQQQYDAARQEFEAVAGGGDAVLEARAAFMIGEIHFARQEYDAAVREFFKVAYAPGPADEALAHWRAESLFEAARCLEQTERFDSADKLYRELVERYPESPKARHARVALEALTSKKR